MNIIVTGCNDCIFCRELDMAVGYSCRLQVDPNKTIEQVDNWTPQTPTWCPIKNEIATIVFDNKD